MNGEDVMLEVTVQLLRNGVVRHKTERHDECVRAAYEPLALGILQVTCTKLANTYTTTEEWK